MQHAEFRQIDRLVSASYQAMPDFGLFTTVSMLYFAAATTFERRFVEFLKQGSNNAPPAFLSADDTEFVSAVNDLTTEVDRLTQSEYLSPPDVTAFTETTRNRLAPWNHVGLLDPAAENMYRYTSPGDID